MIALFPVPPQQMVELLGPNHCFGDWEEPGPRALAILAETLLVHIQSVQASLGIGLSLERE